VIAHRLQHFGLRAFGWLLLGVVLVMALFPPYFMTILGVCYVSAGVVLLAPRLPLVKEWAYAGLMFVYAGATASHLWVGDDATTLVGPLILVGLTIASWALRPQRRRLVSLRGGGPRVR